jgi:internalin A
VEEEFHEVEQGAADVRVLELSLGHSAWYWVHNGRDEQRLRFWLYNGRLLLGEEKRCVGLDLSNTAAERWLRRSSEQERAAVRTAKISNPEDLDVLELLPGLSALECSGLSDEDLEWVCGLGLQLTFLHLSWCARLTTAQPLARMKSLIRLVLSDCPTLKEIAALSHLTNLRHLEIINADQVWEVESLATLKGLERLAIRNCDGIENLAPVSQLSELVWLDLSRCDKVKQLGPLNKLRKLASLNLSDCNTLQDISPLRELDSLDELHLFGCNWVKDLRALYHMCYLRVLSLPNEALDGDLLAICIEHSELEQLDLRNCQNIGDLSPLGRLKHLTQLNLAGCHNIRDLAPLAELPNLVRLDLTCCRSVTGLAPLHGLKKLADLYIGGCINLDQDSVRQFKHACPTCAVHTV